MYRHFLSVLACPLDQSSFSLRSGQLICRKNGHVFPVKKGIPRFVSNENYTASFGFEWQKWSHVQFETRNSDPAMKGYTRKFFQQITTLTPKDVRGKIIVEFGCGPGRFLHLLKQDGATVVGLEMSSAIDVARKNLGEGKNVLLVQGDILHPPFKKNCFDMGFTIGVLHHTPDPMRGLAQLVSIVKPGGKISVNVYSVNGPYNFQSLKIFRRLYQGLKLILGEKIARYFALAYSYFSAYVLYYPIALMELLPKFGLAISYVVRKYFLVVMMIKAASWRVLDTFDAITPEIASTHTEKEVKSWLQRSGIINPQKTRGDTGFMGVKAK